MELLDPRSEGLSDRELLEQFVVDNDELVELESLISQFNIFEAIGAVNQELRHSDFLAFLLNPQQNHGLGDDFLKSLLRKVLIDHKKADLPVSLIDLDIWSLQDTGVVRELDRIDILVTNEANKLVVLIENKIHSQEHSDQLRRYRKSVLKRYAGWNIIPLFLTPDGTLPTHKRYLPIDYATVAGLLEEMLRKRASTLGDDVRMLIDHYVQMLRRHIVRNSDIDELCLKIYRKHQRALDLIFEKRPDMLTGLKDALEELINETPGMIFDRSSKTYIAFTSEELDACTPRSDTQWSSKGRMLLFQFINNPGELRLMLELGPGPAEIRQQLFDISQRHKPPFTTARKKPTSLFTRLWSRSLVSYDPGDIDVVMESMREPWKDFIDNDLPKLTGILGKELAGNGD